MFIHKCIQRRITNNIEIIRNGEKYDHTTRSRGNLYTRKAMTTEGVKGNKVVNKYNTLPEEIKMRQL